MEKETCTMKHFYVHHYKSEIKAIRAAMKDARLEQDNQRRKMLAVNPNARLATAYGATFVM